jgi:hypothetical protein
MLYTAIAGIAGVITNLKEMDTRKITFALI